MRGDDVEVSQVQWQTLRKKLDDFTLAIVDVAGDMAAALTDLKEAAVGLSKELALLEPPRRCEACGKQLVRGMQPNGREEILHQWLKRRYCDRQCAGLGQRKTHTVAPRSCKTCGKQIPMGKLEGPTKYSTRNYCSRACVTARPRGAKQPRTKAPRKSKPKPTHVVDDVPPATSVLPVAPVKPKSPKVVQPPIAPSAYESERGPDGRVPVLVARSSQPAVVSFEPPREAGSERMQVLGEPCPVHPSERLSIYGKCPACVAGGKWAAERRAVTMRPSPEGGR